MLSSGKAASLVAIVLVGIFAASLAQGPDTTTEKTTEAPTTVAPTTVIPTTVAPTTIAPTTAAPPTTPAPSPAPIPSPSTGKWSYEDPIKKDVCLIAQFAMQLNITFESIDNKTSHALYNLPINSTTVTAGSCGNSSDSMTLKWTENEKENLLEIQFVKNDTTKDFRLSLLHFTFGSVGFPNAKANQTFEFFYTGNQFHAPIDMSYHCTKVQQVNLTKTAMGAETVAKLAVAHLQLEAFRHKSTKEFSTAKDCDASDSPDVVPIAVGIALAALIVVVLLAYLVGRRRSQARGYLSM